jgi:hypothetical protein
MYGIAGEDSPGGRQGWVVAALGKVYQWCRPEAIVRVNLCVTDIPNARVFTAKMA